MDDSLVCRKTRRGATELAATHGGALSSTARRVLILLDGRRTLAELAELFGAESVEHIVAELQAQGFARQVDPDDPALTTLPPSVPRYLPPAALEATPEIEAQPRRPPMGWFVLVFVAAASAGGYWFATHGARRVELPTAAAVASEPDAAAVTLASDEQTAPVSDAPQPVVRELPMSMLPALTVSPARPSSATAPAAATASAAPPTPAVASGAPAAPAPAAAPAVAAAEPTPPARHPAERPAPPAASPPSAAVPPPSASPPLAASPPPETRPAPQAPPAAALPPLPAAAPATTRPVAVALADGIQPGRALDSGAGSASLRAAPASAAAPEQASAAPAPAGAPAPASTGAGAAPSVAPDKLAALAAPQRPQSGPVTLRPRRHDPPEYPVRALRARIDEGHVLARIWVTAEGKVDQVDIVKATPARVFDDEVRRALSAWTFDPPGRPVDTTIELTFKP